MAGGTESRDYLAGPGVEQQQEQSGVEVQQLEVGQESLALGLEV